MSVDSCIGNIESERGGREEVELLCLWSFKLLELVNLDMSEFFRREIGDEEEREGRFTSFGALVWGVFLGLLGRGVVLGLLGLLCGSSVSFEGGITVASLERDSEDTEDGDAGVSGFLGCF